MAEATASAGISAMTTLIADDGECQTRKLLVQIRKEGDDV